MEEKSFFDYMTEKGDRKTPIFTKIRWKFERIGDAYRSVKWFFQRLFRSYHASDYDMWNFSSHLTPIILGKLIAFRKSRLHGYPSIFSEYAENEWKSKKEYDEAVAKGEILGGGFDAWLEALDEMIFAFEFLAYYEVSDKKRNEMLKKYNLKYPHEKIAENKDIGYVYKHKENGSVMLSGFSPDEEKDSNYIYLGESISYHNFELEQEYYERVKRGLQLFAKYYMNLWD